MARRHFFIQVITWSHVDIPGIDPKIKILQVNPHHQSVRQKICKFALEQMIYHGFYQFLAMVYSCFRFYLLCFGVFLESV